MSSTKNYSYLAIQVGKICSQWAKRRQQQVLNKLDEIARPVRSATASDEPSRDASPTALPRDSRPQPSRPVLHVARPLSSSDSRHSSDSCGAGVQALASVVGLQLRFALRRWETYVRRKRFDELQTKVVLTLQNVSAPAVASPQGLEMSTAWPAAVVRHRQEPEDAFASYSAVATHPEDYSRSPLGEKSLSSSLFADSKHADGHPIMQATAAVTSDEDFVRSLSDDQSRVDEIIKLAVLLWESGSLVQIQPMTFLRASLLVRVAERCQKHVMRDAVQCLWKRCSLQRSVEELLAKGELVKRKNEFVTQMPVAESGPMKQEPEDFMIGCEGQHDARSEKVKPDPAESGSFDEPSQVFDGAQAEFTAELDLPTVVTQPFSKPASNNLPEEIVENIPFSQSSQAHEAAHQVDRAVPDLSEDPLPEVQSGSTGEESDIDDDDLANLLG